MTQVRQECAGALPRLERQMAEVTGERLATDTGAAAGTPMPPAAKWAILGAVGALLAGAVVLLALRGNALLLDLSALGARIFCL